MDQFIELAIQIDTVSVSTTVNWVTCVYPVPGDPALVSVSINALNSDSCLTVPIIIHVNGRNIKTTALIDSGAASNFLSQGFAQKYMIPLTKCNSSLTVEAVDGRLLGTGKISSLTQELTIQTGLLHSEKILYFTHHRHSCYSGSSLATTT